MNVRDLVTIRYLPTRRRGMAFKLLREIYSTEAFATRLLSSRCKTGDSLSHSAALAAVAGADALLGILGPDSGVSDVQDSGVD